MKHILARLDARRLELRKAFVAKHGTDPTAWKAEFVRTHPEHGVLLDEVEARTREVSRRQVRAGVERVEHRAAPRVESRRVAALVAGVAAVERDHGVTKEKPPAR